MKIALAYHTTDAANRNLSIWSIVYNKIDAQANTGSNFH
jgi:hypothetical protein